MTMYVCNKWKISTNIWWGMYTQRGYVWDKYVIFNWREYLIKEQLTFDDGVYMEITKLQYDRLPAYEDACTAPIKFTDIPTDDELKKNQKNTMR